MTDQSCTTFAHLPEVWKDGIVPDELRDVETWKAEIDEKSEVENEQTNII